MLIDCTHCQARVNAEVVKSEAYYDREVWPESLQAREMNLEEWRWCPGIWPEPISQLAMSIPETIRTCLLEARQGRPEAPGQGQGRAALGLVPRERLVYGL